VVKFDEALRDGRVRTETPDKNRAAALKRDAAERLNLAKTLLSMNAPKFSLENSYEAIRQVVDATLLERGFKSYSHEATIAYLRDVGCSLVDQAIADNLRQQRHRIKYYGGDATKEEAENAVAIAERIIRKLENRTEGFRTEDFHPR